MNALTSAEQVMIDCLNEKFPYVKKFYENALLAEIEKELPKRKYIKEGAEEGGATMDDMWDMGYNESIIEVKAMLEAKRIKEGL